MDNKPFANISVLTESSYLAVILIRFNTAQLRFQNNK